MNPRGYGWLSSALLLAALAGCEDSAAPEVESLSANSSGQLAAALYTAAVEAALPGLPETDGGDPSGYAAPATSTVDTSVGCPEGGAMTVTGDVTNEVSEELGIGSVGIQLLLDPIDCQVATSQGVFALDADPGVTASGSLAFGEGEALQTFVVSFVGELGWRAEVGEGGCNASLSYQVDYVNPDQSFASGVMCGHVF